VEKLYQEHHCTRGLDGNDWIYDKNKLMRQREGAIESNKRKKTDTVRYLDICTSNRTLLVADINSAS
jgi:hypothetical protein